MKKLVYILIMLAVSAACTKEKKYVPQDGDLAFQVVAPSEFSDAIVTASAQGDSIKFAHVAIVALKDGKPYVIEASSEDGVTWTEWEEFLSSSGKINGKPGVVVKRVSVDFPLDKAMARVKAHIGEAYDWSFYPDNGKMYCSELVYECFRKEDGTPLFTARPMNFRAIDGSMPAFWIELFDRLGEPIPEGVIGTSPSDMSKEPVLTEVYRFF